MPDIPPASLAAVALVIHRAACPLRDDPDHDCARDAANEELFIPRARAALEAAAPLLAETLRIEIVNLHGHLDADHAVMVQLGRIADAAVQLLEHVSMDTDEDRELHARAVGALRDRLGEIAAAVKEANDTAPAAAVREDEDHA